MISDAVIELLRNSESTSLILVAVLNLVKGDESHSTKASSSDSPLYYWLSGQETGAVIWIFSCLVSNTNY